MPARQLKKKKKIKKDAVKMDDRRDERGGGEEEIAVRMHLSRIVLHKRKKCIQHRSPAVEETEIEKGKSEFAHLGKTSHWRQSISNSALTEKGTVKILQLSA